MKGVPYARDNHPVVRYNFYHAVKKKNINYDKRENL